MRGKALLTIRQLRSLASAPGITMEKKSFVDILRNGTVKAALSRMNKGVDFHEKDATGKTVLHLAVTKPTFERVVRDIISMGVNVRAVDELGRTPLHDAALAGTSTSILEMILNNAIVNAKDKQGRTALHDAVLSGIENNVRLLLQRGANIRAEDNNGCNALQQELAPGCDRMLCLLISQTANEKRLGRAKTGAIRRRNNTEAGAQKGLGIPSKTTCRLEHWTFNWAGLEVYKTEQADFENVLTISTRDPSTHAYTALTVDEYLQKFFPSFGSILLMWIKNVCRHAVRNATDSGTEKSLQEIRIDGLANQDISSPLVSTIQGESPRNNRCLTLTGIMRGEILTITLSAPENTPTSDVKAALAWALLALEPQEPGVTGLFSIPADAQALDDGLPRALEPISCNAESYYWKEMFSSAVVMNLRQDTTIDTAQQPGLEINLDTLIEIAAVDREARFKNGAHVKYGIESLIASLEPAEKKRWHYLETPGEQMTPRKAVKQLLNHLGEDFRLAANYLPGRVYVGWCPHPVMNPCPKGELARYSGVPVSKEIEDKSERGQSTEISLLGRFGFAGSSVGGSIGHKREQKYRPVALAVKLSVDGSLEEALKFSRTTPCLLWNHSTKTAYLVPQTMILAFATLRFVEWMGYFQNGQSRSSDGKSKYQPARSRCVPFRWSGKVHPQKREAVGPRGQGRGIE